MPPVISVVIPCYNHGQYILEAIESVEQNSQKYSYEIIIVNDGSTDEFTNLLLNRLAGQGYHVLNQSNQGLPSARNRAIAVATGKYVIPLDSDNKLHASYLNRAIDILDSDPYIDVLYANSWVFGQSHLLYKPGPFNIGRIVEQNFIDACAVFKREVWEKAGGYDNMMIKGFEDWEYWIRVYLSGGRFYYLNELGFYYRHREDSMVRKLSNPATESIKGYIYQKHYQQLIPILSKEAKTYKCIADYVYASRYKAAVKLFLGLKLLRL